MKHEVLQAEVDAVRTLERAGFGVETVRVNQVPTDSGTVAEIGIDIVVRFEPGPEVPDDFESENDYRVQ